ncbi:MAG: hypothetical protein ACRDX8_12385, partial [Acidimicrobiales bacterium]
RDWYSDVGRLRRRSRLARGTPWFPLLLFGVIVLASIPLYLPGSPCGTHRSCVFELPQFFPAGVLSARRRGVTRSVRAFVATGVGLLGLLVVTSLAGLLRFSDLTVRGLTPLITIAIALFVLARPERSWSLAAFATTFLALVLLANLYDIENMTYRIGRGSFGAMNVVVVGVALLLGGIGFGLSGLLAGRKGTHGRGKQVT